MKKGGKKTKTIKGNKAENTIESRIAGKEWGYIVEELPKSVQKLACSAMESYEKKNVRGMEAAVSQIREGNTVRIRFLLALLYEEKNFEQSAVKLLEELIDEENVERIAGETGQDVTERDVKDNSSRNAAEESVGEVYIKNLLEIPSKVRVEVYKAVLAEVYESLQEPEKVVQTLRDMFPMQRKVARCYEMYLAGLMATEQYEEGHAVTEEEIAFLTKGVYGEDYWVDAYENSYTLAEDRIQLIRQSIAEGKNPRYAATVVAAYEALAEFEVELGRIEQLDGILATAAGFVRNLDEDTKHHLGFMVTLGDVIVACSMMSNHEEGCREPFRKLLEITEKSGIFDQAYDPNGYFSDLLPSGFRTLEYREYMADDRIGRFIGGMFADISHRGEADRQEGQDAYFMRMSAYAAAWNLGKYCLLGHAEEFKSACEYFLKEYPYTGRLVKDDTDEILHDTKGFMDRIIERLMRESKGRKAGHEEFEAGMEDAYYKTMAAMQKG